MRTWALNQAGASRDQSRTGHSCRENTPCLGPRGWSVGKGHTHLGDTRWQSHYPHRDQCLLPFKLLTFKPCFPPRSLLLSEMGPWQHWVQWGCCWEDWVTHSCLSPRCWEHSGGQERWVPGPTKSVRQGDLLGSGGTPLDLWSERALSAELSLREEWLAASQDHI